MPRPPPISLINYLQKGLEKIGMFSVDENINGYINNCTLSELNELAEIIAMRKAAVRDKQKKELAVKLKEAFDDYKSIAFCDDDPAVEVEITDNNGYTTTYSIELKEAVVTSQNRVVFKAYDLDINDY